MPEWVQPFMIIGTVTFFITGFILLVFPVEVYLGAKRTDLSSSNKGRFAKTAFALHQIKHNGFGASGEYWWHVIWFNTLVSASVATFLTFFSMLVAGIVIIAITILVLRVWISG